MRPKKDEDISTRLRNLFDDPVRKITFAIKVTELAC
jgi:hypothetical protein